MTDFGAPTDTDRLLRNAHDRYSGMLRGFVISLPYDAALADDVVQETLLRAWQHAEILTRPEPVVRAWLCKVARNMVIDDLRSARRRREIVVETLPESAHDDDTDRLFERWIIAEALSTLPADQKAVISGAYHGGRSVAQLATEFGIPTGTVKSRLHYGMRALRVALQERGVVS
ncbi:sigma-70 family RNA polymerase sigma factor [Microbacterium sp. EST19A]|uniref:sigma-70 family RNA polymerase sigma factor n=1 Tax=Microbacterium sp. EST19A TaxID=2862681 RepID=UPI001CBBFBD5|nr:sigma-70 family RNA polymerase sigma factor [Microbacterium sp. EST19A]